MAGTLAFPQPVSVEPRPHVEPTASPDHHNLPIPPSQPLGAWSLWGLRVGCLTTLGSTGGCLWTAAVVGFSPALTTGCLAGTVLSATVLAGGYWNSAWNRLRRSFQQQLAWKEVEQQIQSTTLKQQSEQSQKLRSRYERLQRLIEQCREESNATVEQQINRYQRECEKARSNVRAQRKLFRCAAADLARELQKVRVKLKKKHKKQLRQYHETCRLASAVRLKQRQEEFVNNALAAHTLQAATIPGVGAKLKEKIIQAGIHSAAEVTSERLAVVEGCGPKKAQQLLEWANRWREQAEAQQPLVLDAADLEALQTEHAAGRQHLANWYREMLGHWVQEADALRKKYADAMEQFDSILNRLQVALKARCNQVRYQAEQTFREHAGALVAKGMQIRASYLEAQKAVEQAKHQEQHSEQEIEALRAAVESCPSLHFGDYLRLLLGWTPPQDHQAGSEPRILKFPAKTSRRLAA